MICKVGDIFRTPNDVDGNYTLAYDSVNYFCKLVDIVDIEGKSYDEMNIITGHGDKNTKVVLYLKVLYSENMEDANPMIIQRDPHKVYKVNIKYELNKIKKKRKFLDKKEEFLKNNLLNLDEKLNKILNE